MIKKEFYKVRTDGVKLYRNYSDENYKILQVESGQVFDEAIDVENANFTYKETDEKNVTEETEVNSTEQIEENTNEIEGEK